eukprot:scaffold370_cov289-Prasinococcus_capsulatus_cf.AAC.13
MSRRALLLALLALLLGGEPRARDQQARGGAGVRAASASSASWGSILDGGGGHSTFRGALLDRVGLHLRGGAPRSTSKRGSGAKAKAKAKSKSKSKSKSKGKGTPRPSTASDVVSGEAAAGDAAAARSGVSSSSSISNAGGGNDDDEERDALLRLPDAERTSLEAKRCALSHLARGEEPRSRPRPAPRGVQLAVGDAARVAGAAGGDGRRTSPTTAPSAAGWAWRPAWGPARTRSSARRCASALQTQRRRSAARRSLTRSAWLGRCECPVLPTIYPEQCRSMPMDPGRFATSARKDDDEDEDDDARVVSCRVVSAAARRRCALRCAASGRGCTSGAAPRAARFCTRWARAGRRCATCPSWGTFPSARWWAAPPSSPSSPPGTSSTRPPPSSASTTRPPRATSAWCAARARCRTSARGDGRVRARAGAQVGSETTVRLQNLEFCDKPTPPAKVKVLDTPFRDGTCLDNRRGPDDDGAEALPSRELPRPKLLRRRPWASCPGAQVSGIARTPTATGTRRSARTARA